MLPYDWLSLGAVILTEPLALTDVLDCVVACHGTSFGNNRRAIATTPLVCDVPAANTTSLSVDGNAIRADNRQRISIQQPATF